MTGTVASVRKLIATAWAAQEGPGQALGSLAEEILEGRGVENWPQLMTAWKASTMPAFSLSESMKRNCFGIMERTRDFSDLQQQDLGIIKETPPWVDREDQNDHFAAKRDCWEILA